MSDDDVTEITCDGCTGASDWYCVKCWDSLVAELHNAEVQRDAALALLGNVKRGKHTVEEAAEVLWALMDARVGSVANDLANIMRAMRDGRSTIHWRADETAATALVRERDQLAAQVEELHARLREVGL
jgi:hypothetical protein